jgi:hypothetical protein
MIAVSGVGGSPVTRPAERARGGREAPDSAAGAVGVAHSPRGGLKDRVRVVQSSVIDIHRDHAERDGPFTARTE